MKLLYWVIAITLMAFYSYNLNSEIIKVKKYVAPQKPKTPKKSKTQKENQVEEEEREHECEKDKMICRN